MLIVMSWFISAICETSITGLDGRVVKTSERESSMRRDSGSKPVKSEGEFTRKRKLEESSTENAKRSREKESETKEITTSKENTVP